MAWGKVDDKLYSSPKWMQVSKGGKALWVSALSWCMAQLTDGAVPKRTCSMLGANTQDARSLVEAGLWTETQDGYQFHDWLDYQPSREQVLAEREAARQRQQKAREKAKASRKRHGVTNDVTHDEVQEPVTGDVTVPPTRPDPTRPDPNREPNGYQERTLAPEVPEREDVTALLDLLDREIEANGNRPPKRSKANRDAMRLLLDRDHRTPDQVAYVIRWCQADDFWQANILSASKLREKFDQLVAKIRSNHQRANRPSEKEQRNQDILNAFVAEEDHPYIEGIPA